MRHSDGQEQEEMRTRSSDPPLKVTREIPLVYLIGGAIGLTVQAVTILNSVSDLKVAVKEVNTTVNTMALKAVTMEGQLGDVQRRVDVLEARQNDIMRRLAAAEAGKK